MYALLSADLKVCRRKHAAATCSFSAGGASRRGGAAEINLERGQAAEGKGASASHACGMDRG
jgi:hypothetical protein